MPGCYKDAFVAAESKGLGIDLHDGFWRLSDLRFADAIFIFSGKTRDRLNLLDDLESVLYRNWGNIKCQQDRRIVKANATTLYFDNATTSTIAGQSYVTKA